MKENSMWGEVELPYKQCECYGCVPKMVCDPKRNPTLAKPYHKTFEYEKVEYMWERWLGFSESYKNTDCRNVFMNCGVI